MSTIQEIEMAVTQLSPEQLADFRAWFAEFEAQRWGQRIATGVAPIHLNNVANAAVVAQLPEQEAWHQLAAQNLALAYGDNELEYTVADLQKLNSAYRAS